MLALLLSAGCATPPTDTNHDHETRGKAIFRESCMLCHGMNGAGDGWVRFSPPVTDLTAPRIQQKLDDELLKSIHEGRGNTAMGSWRLVLSDEDRKDVLSYIRSLQHAQ
jgi:mono/diheme cytochrome c family protein